MNRRNRLNRTLGIFLVAALALAVFSLPVSGTNFTSPYYWNQIRAGAYTNLNALTATDADHIWLAGGGGPNGMIVKTSNGGGSWTEYTEAGWYLGGIFALDNTHVWAVGDNGTNLGRVFCWNSGAGTWGAQNTPFDYRLNGATAVSPTQAWVVGRDRATNNGRILYSDGGAYNSGAAGTVWVEEFNDASGIRVSNVDASDANNVWAVGYVDDTNGKILKRNPATGTWSVNHSYGRRLDGVCVVDSRHIYACGYNGTVLYTANGGTSWKVAATPGTTDMATITASDPDHVWAGGLGGEMYVYQDGRWDSQFVGTYKFKGSACLDQYTVFMGAGNNTPRADNVYRGAPKMITSVSPGSGVQGATNRNLRVKAAGTSFKQGDTQVTFSGTGITVNSVTVNSKTDLTVNVTIAGDAPVGARDLNVSTAAGAETETPRGVGFSVIYNPYAPRISSVTPMSAPVGTEVTIRGINFGASRGPSMVVFNGTEASDYKSWSDSTIKVLVPAGAISGPLTVVTPSGTSNVVNFSVTYGKFYFAEGSVRPEFETYYCIQNPGDEDADIKVTYMMDDGTTKEEEATVPSGSRATLNAGATVSGAGNGSMDFSAVVETTNGTGVLVERPMYFNYKGAWTGGHDVIGAVKTSLGYYFAEGTTRPGFDSYFCVQNPNEADTEVKVTYMLGDGTTKEETLSVPAMSRRTVVVAQYLGTADSLASDFSAKVESTSGVGIVVERPMYFNYKGAWTGGHNVMGVEEPATAFHFAEGSTRPGLDPYFCILNPGEEEAEVKLTYMLTDGTSKDETVTVPGMSRYTVNPKITLGSADGPKYDFSTTVESTNEVPIVVERPMYFIYKGAWTGGHNVMGASEPAPVFNFAEGTTRPNFDPYFCVFNPNLADVKVRVRYAMGDGTAKEQLATVLGMSRFTFVVKDFLGEGDDQAHDFSATVESIDGLGIVVERPQYFNFKGAWDGGHDVMGFTL